MKIAIIPGRYQPITSGHMKVIQLAEQECDRVYVVVIGSNNKSPTAKSPIPLEANIKLIKKCVGSNVTVMTYQIANLDVMGDDIAKDLGLAPTHGVSEVKIYCGTDRSTYDSQLKYFNGFEKDGIDKTKGKKDIFHAEIREVTRTALDVSGTQVREVINNWYKSKSEVDKKKFMNLTPVQIHGDLNEIAEYISAVYSKNESIFVKIYDEISDEFQL